MRNYRQHPPPPHSHWVRLLLLCTCLFYLCRKQFSLRSCWFASFVFDPQSHRFASTSAFALLFLAFGYCPPHVSSVPTRAKPQFSSRAVTLNPVYPTDHPQYGLVQLLSDSYHLFRQQVPYYLVAPLAPTAATFRLPAWAPSLSCTPFLMYVNPMDFGNHVWLPYVCDI